MKKVRARRSCVYRGTLRGSVAVCARARLQRRGGARRKVELWPAVGCSGKSACATKGSSGHFVYEASESKGKYVPTSLIEVGIRKLP